MARIKSKKKADKNNSFGKLTLFICLPIIIVFVGLALLVLNFVRANIYGLTDSNLAYESQFASAQIGQYSAKYIEITKQMAANAVLPELLGSTTPGTSITAPASYPYAAGLLAKVKETDPDNIITTWIADFDTSQFIQSDGNVSEPGYDITTRDWYKQVQAEKKSMLTEPYKDNVTGKSVISALTPITLAGSAQIAGVAAMDFSMDNINLMTKSCKLGKTGYFMLVTPAGTLVSHPDSSQIYKNVKELDVAENLKTAVAKKQSGLITYNGFGQVMHGYLAVEPHSGYMVISALPEKEYKSSVFQFGNALIITFSLTVILVLAVVFILSRRISAPVTQLKSAADQVFVNSTQVSQGAQSLAQGATEQASSIEELSTTFSTISEQIKKNARDAQEASKIAELSGKEICMSNEQMSRLMAAINEIKNTSNKIVSINKTIDSIAFQTNILALNAAVEAARAGASGKGFAVVASEVKSLANKSSESAKTTSELITSTLKAVDDGIQIAEETRATLEEAVTSSGSTVALVDDIANASVEHAAMIVQITDALNQISSVVQDTSATAEESAAASEELDTQSRILMNLVNRFTFTKEAAN